VMCSTTHAGFRVRLSKLEVREDVGRKSAIGPGKPYWKRPFGSTGGCRVLRGLRAKPGAGTGAGSDVAEGDAVVVVVIGGEDVCFRFPL
jgi:hypothetical protein